MHALALRSQSLTATVQETDRLVPVSAVASWLGMSEGAVLEMIDQHNAHIRQTTDSPRAGTGEGLPLRAHAARDSRRPSLELISANAAARMLATTPATLKYWRIVGKGPTAYKIGSRWKYNCSDVLAFAESGKHIASVRVAVEENLERL
jgi:hypothetical protein